jgi:flagellin
MNKVGIEASVDGAGTITFTADDVDGVEITGATAGTAALGGLAAGVASVASELELSSGNSFVLRGTALDELSGGLTATGGSSALNAISTISISTQNGAQDALAAIDGALSFIDNERADLGAVQNRFSYTISNLANIQENVSASRSRIQDTDFAVETAQMTKNQILQQAGTSILAQANQIPQAAISLIGG